MTKASIMLLKESTTTRMATIIPIPSISCFPGRRIIFGEGGGGDIDLFCIFPRNKVAGYPHSAGQSNESPFFKCVGSMGVRTLARMICALLCSSLRQCQKAAAAFHIWGFPYLPTVRLTLDLET